MTQEQTHAGLIAMHVIFVREHNRLAEMILSQNESLNDEQVYQLARKINTAQMQRITYSEYLPSLGIELADYEGFDETIDRGYQMSLQRLRSEWAIHKLLNKH